jgi:hypothetical protein
LYERVEFHITNMTFYWYHRFEMLDETGHEQHKLWSVVFAGVFSGTFV